MDFFVTKTLNRHDYHGSKGSPIEAVCGDYILRQNYQIGSSWSAYFGRKCIADCVSLTQAKEAARGHSQAETP